MFSGLYRVVESSEEKDQVDSLGDKETIEVIMTETIYESLTQLITSLKQVLPVKAERMAIISRLVKKTGQLREEADHINQETQEILDRALREVSELVAPDDKAANDALDSARTRAEELE